MLKELKYTNNDSNILQSNGNYELKGAIKVKNLLEGLNITFKLTKEIISKQRDPQRLFNLLNRRAPWKPTDPNMLTSPEPRESQKQRRGS